MNLLESYRQTLAYSQYVTMPRLAINLDKAKELTGRGDAREAAAWQIYETFFAPQHVSGRFRRLLIDHTRIFDRGYFEANPFVMNVKTPEETQANPFPSEEQIAREIRGNEEGLHLTRMGYGEGEMEEYGAPIVEHGIAVSRIGVITCNYDGLCLMRGDGPVMALSPSEMETMQPAVDHAEGSVLALGLGLGYFAYMALMKPQVTRVTIVEKSRELIDLFREQILPQFPRKADVTLICMEPAKYVSTMTGPYDYCFAASWKDQMEGLADALELIHIMSDRHHDLKTDYWLLDSMISMRLADALLGERRDEAEAMLQVMKNHGWASQDSTL